MTNWASRQGFTEAVRDQFKLRLHGSKTAKLTKTEEVGSGILGGAPSLALPETLTTQSVMGVCASADQCSIVPGVRLLQEVSMVRRHEPY